MKKNIFLNSMAAALLTGVVAMGGLTSCASDDDAVEQKPAETNVHKISIPASFGGDETRFVQFNANSNTVTASFVAADNEYVTTDKIYVYNETKSEMLSGYLSPTDISDNSTTCQLTGTVTGSLAAGDELTLVYNPSSVTTGAGGNYTFDYTDQNGSAYDTNTSTKYSASEHDFAIARVKLVQGADDVWTVAAGYTVEFVNQQSMFKFDLTFDGAAYNSGTMTINSLTISAGTDHLYTSRNFNGGTGSSITITNPSLTDNKLFLALAFASEPTSLTLRANVTISGVTSDYEWTKTLSSGSFQNGKFYYGTAAFEKTGLYNNGNLVVPVGGNYTLVEGNAYTLYGSINGNVTGRGHITLNMMDGSEINGCLSLTSYIEGNIDHSPIINLYGDATINNSGTALVHVAENYDGRIFIDSHYESYALTVNGNVNAYDIELTPYAVLRVNGDTSIAYIESEGGSPIDYDEYGGYKIWEGRFPEEPGDY